ncbi:MAG: energy-coupling factor transporter ATPase [Clostridiales bacterium]|nr:energy-coupling factor transporter ATPase [Clostridiales bacterium]
MKYIDINNLNYRYPSEEQNALSDITLKIDKGDMLLIAGESGSGKSTLAKCIAGTVPGFYGGTISGSILIAGKPIKEMSHKERSKEITMVFQDPERQLVMDKVHREVAFGLQNIGIHEGNIKRRVFEALQFSGILDLSNRDINTLSGGQKQKVALASAIALLPGCIILDEPTSQLDPSSSEEVISLAKKVNEELGINIIVIEQRINRWFDSADRIAVLKGGRLLFCGTAGELYESANSYITNFLPTGLRLSKSLGIFKMPGSFKENRQKLSHFDFNPVPVHYDKKSKEVIGIKNLSVDFGSIRAIKDIDLKIYGGDFAGIIGANGAGKSTLLRSIMGFLKYSGSIRILGAEACKQTVSKIARTCGYVSQNPNDYISKDTVYDELKFTLDNYGIKDEGIIDETLDLLGIYDLRNKNPRDISGGERQRVAIASIIVLKPKILLLDEPTRGLDGNVLSKLGCTLKKLNGSGTTIVLITHDIEFAARYCSRFVLMFNGEIAADGSRDSVLSGGIYYTTEINRLLRNKNEHLFTLEQALLSAGGEHE